MQFQTHRCCLSQIDTNHSGTVMFGTFSSWHKSVSNTYATVAIPSLSAKLSAVFDLLETVSCLFSLLACHPLPCLLTRLQEGDTHWWVFVGNGGLIWLPLIGKWTVWLWYADNLICWFWPLSKAQSQDYGCFFFYCNCSCCSPMLPTKAQISALYGHILFHLNVCTPS